MTLATPVRNVRNNNPGNIENNGTQWAGMAAPFQMTPDQHAESRFCVFLTPMMGFRALAVLLRTCRYSLHPRQHQPQLDTISKLIAHFAPPIENVTDAYIAHVALDINIDPDVPVDLNDPVVLTAMCRSIAVRESGGAWMFDVKDLGAGVDLALYPAVRGLVS